LGVLRIEKRVQDDRQLSTEGTAENLPEELIELHNVDGSAGAPSVVELFETLEVKLVDYSSERLLVLDLAYVLQQGQVQVDEFLRGFGLGHVVKRHYQFLRDVEPGHTKEVEGLLLAGQLEHGLD
jgi:hypothetical protein